VKLAVCYGAMTQPTLASPAPVYSEVSVVWQLWGDMLIVTAPVHPPPARRAVSRSLLPRAARNAQGERPENPARDYVSYGCNGLEEAKQLAVRKNVADMIQWQDFYSADELAKVYQRSKACIIPFTGGSARHPLTSAMVNGTPVIATKAVDIPEYLGDLGIYVDGSATSIADAIRRCEIGEEDLKSLGDRLRHKALTELDYNRIAQELGGEYTRIGRKRQLISIEPAAVVWLVAVLIKRACNQDK
jgi:hypothetical protein